MRMRSIGRLLVFWVWLVPAGGIAASEYTEEALERWFNSDEFAPPRPSREVNDGQLVFLHSPGGADLHHHHNHMTVSPRSLEDGWVRLEQCHTHLDKVPAAQIVFNEQRIRDIRLVSFRNMGKAWVEGPTVQMTDIRANARVCITAWTRALCLNDDGSYSLRNGPFMRRFLDGYFPMRVSMVIDYAGTGLRPTVVFPAQQDGFMVWRKDTQIGFDAVFEGRLTTEFSFEVETP